MKPLVQIRNDSTLDLNFHEGQLRAWHSHKRFVFVLAATQGGKTVFGPWWLWREIYDPKIGKGPGDYLVVTATYDLFKLKMLPEMLNAFEHTLQCGRYYPGERIIELKNPHTGKFEARKASDPMWARIILRSAVAGTKRGQEGAGGLESATAKAAWLDECGLDEFSLQAWQAVLRRLSLTQGRVLGTTTIYNLGWMKCEIYDRWEAGDPDYDVIQFDALQNPAFPRAEYERARRTLPSWKFNMQYRGVYDRPAGMIYSDFEEGVHLVNPFPIPSSWPVVVGIDPGPIHTALLWIAEDNLQERFYVFRESLEGDLTTRQHAERALRDAAGYSNVRWIGGSKSEKQFRWDWQQEGVYVEEPAIDDVEAGIDRVIGMFKERKLYVFENLTGLRDEFGSYARVLDERGQSTERIKNKEMYHRLDALRYAVSLLAFSDFPQPSGEFISTNPNFGGVSSEQSATRPRVTLRQQYQQRPRPPGLW